MTIASALTDLNTDIQNARTAITNKGGTVTVDGGSSQLATDIGTIPTGIQPTGTISITQNGTYNVTNYASADVNVSGGGGEMFGMTAEDYFYAFPSNITTLDTTAPNVDMSSKSGSFSSYTMSYFFQWSRVKSINTAYFTNSATYVFAYMFQNNKCIQYVKINTTRTDISANYCIYNNVNNASNVKVEVVNFAPNTVVRGQYNTYLFGASGTSGTTKIKSARVDNVIRVYGNGSFGNTVSALQSIQTFWMPDLIGISDTANNYNSFQYFANNTPKLIGFFAPKLKQIGYSSTGSSYAQMRQSITNQSTLFSDFYLPALTTVHNVNTNSANGTFAGNDGVKKFYFPMLSVIDGSGAPYIFSRCTNTEFHFGKANQAAIEATSGYSTLWGRGAGNATVYFDLINDITVDGKTYHRTQENDYMTQLTYNNKVYYRDDASRNANNIEWKFWAWKASDNSVVYTQNPLSLVTEAVWEYVANGNSWDYNDLGNITANDWRYAWTNPNNANDIIYTTNQYTPAVGDPTYTKASDGKSFVAGSNITAVA